MEELTQHPKFYGDENDNPVEFLRECEKMMYTVGNQMIDQDRINFIPKDCNRSAAQWCTIIRDQATTYKDFVQAFETRYWNQHVQRKLRDRLEFGKYECGQTKEQHVIQQVTHAKRLRPRLNVI